MERDPHDFMVICPHCDLVMQMHEHCFAGQKASCPRCHSKLETGWVHSETMLLLLTLTGLFFYIPANFYPMMAVEMKAGMITNASVFDGIFHLFTKGQWFTALLVFFCSMLTPALIIFVLLYLSITLKYMQPRRHHQELFRVVCHLDSWVMLDVYLISFCVAMFKMKDLGVLHPNWGLLALICLAVTMIYLMCQLDKRQIWEKLRH
ncbi:paraquat-inducible protein A [Algicola sagamiensis]|uniref:paraquat-inducible protein A n=1 Tax=Algicola sagamiensis TaxID=163869 RepID=UPI00036F6CC2|nr:paraquat-inducible protein A [Algicola sagamiensis]